MPLRRLEIHNWIGLIVLPVCCLLIAFGYGGERAFPLGAFPDDFFYFEFADGFGVKALGESDNKSFAFSADEFVMIDFDDA